jgi:serine/threonine-protein kinase
MSHLPATIGHYQVRTLLAQGGMGVLYLARDPHLDRLAAIKVLKLDSDELRQRFLREARIAARLQHPNIVSIYGVGEHESQPFIAMEYISGDTLADLIRRWPPLPLLHRLRLLEALCQGLAFAHREGVVHRDVKPANVMVSRDGLLKILDFGIARAEATGMTQAGMVMGTPSYMSPEQVQGATVDHRADIFAVGVIAYEMLARSLPFAGGSPVETLRKIVSYTPPPVSRLEPSLDPELDLVVTRAINKRPADRYHDLEAMRADLVRIDRRIAQFLDDTTTVVTPAGGVAPPTLTLAEVPPTPRPSTPESPTPAPPRPATPVRAATPLPGGPATPVKVADTPIDTPAPPQAAADWESGAELALRTDAGLPPPAVPSAAVPGTPAIQPAHAMAAGAAVLVAALVATWWLLGSTRQAVSPPASTAAQPASPLVEEAPEVIEEPEIIADADPQARPPDARVPLAEAGGGPASGEATTAPAGPAPAEPAPARPPPKTPAELAEEREESNLRATIYRYKLAYESLDPSAIRRVFPSVDAAQLEPLFANYRTLAFVFTGFPEVRQINDAGTEATVACAYRIEIMLRDGSRQAPPPVTAQFVMQKQADAWLIRRIDILR